MIAIFKYREISRFGLPGRTHNGTFLHTPSGRNAMRLLTIAALGFSLIAAPAMAQQANGQESSNHKVFASVTCPQQFPCPGDTQLSSSDISSIANSCVTLGFNAKNNVTYFDDTSSLDANNCLSLSTSIQTSKIQPRCCVRQLQDNSCVLHCDLSN